MRLFAGAIALFGPGLEGWAASREILAGRRPLAPAPCAPPPPASLPPAERRRTTAAIRLAMAAADASLAAANLGDLRRLASVFGSSNGDGVVIDAILKALASPERLVSPTQFHNSVHNGPPAYWSIATGSQGSSTSYGCWDATFAVSFLHAAAKVTTRREPLLLCAYDAPLPAPLSAMRPTSFAFATAMMLTPRQEPFSIAAIEVSLASGTCAPESAAPRLATLLPIYHGNAAARSLRLLETLAREEAAMVPLDYLDDTHIRLELAPC